MTKPCIESYAKNADPRELAATLRDQGAVIVREVLPGDVVDELVGAVQPFLEISPSADFYGERVRTCSNLFGRDAVFAEPLLLNGVVLDVLDRVLLPEQPMGPSTPKPAAGEGSGATYDETGINKRVTRDALKGPNCHHYRVHFSGAVQIGAGGGTQPLHRDMDVYKPYIDHDPDQPDWIVALNYAGTDFTEENGATRIVPGSHRWPADREAEPHEEAQAVMPKGSALIWLGRAFHGLAPNRSSEDRAGLITVFGTNWLSQEENQFISVPPEMAEKLPKAAQQLLGYRAGSVGWATGRDPEQLLQPGTATYI